MAKTQNFGFTIKDFFEGWTEVWTAEAQEITRMLLCKWTERTDVMRDLLGWSRPMGTAGITRVLPNSHPEFITNMHVHRVTVVRGIGVASEVGPFDEFKRIQYADVANDSCMLQVEYKNFDYFVLPDDDPVLTAHAAVSTKELGRYVSRYQTLATESQPVPGQTFKTSADNKPINEPGARHTAILTVRYVWHQVPRVPVGDITSLVGKVNASTFDQRPAFSYGAQAIEAFDGYAAETMLFVGADWKMTHSVNRENQFEVEYQWLWREATWNKVYRRTGASGPGFYAVVANDGTGVKPYTASNMNALFDL